MAPSRSAFRSAFSICLLGFWLALSHAQGFPQWSCTGTEPSCQSVFVVHDSWHAAVVLRRSRIPLDVIPELADFSQADFVEFSCGAKISELSFNAQAYDRLISYVSETVSRPTAKERAQPSPGLFPYSRFYPARRDFSVLRTCNTWVAEALEKAGLPIAPHYVITAGNLQSQLSTIKLSP